MKAWNPYFSQEAMNICLNGTHNELSINSDMSIEDIELYITSKNFDSVLYYFNTNPAINCEPS